MTARQLRIGAFLVSAPGLAALFGWGVAGLHSFGSYAGPYGIVLNGVTQSERHVTNVVSAVTFDYRGIDTMGEEFILFAAVMGVALLLREERGERRPRDRVRSDPVRLAGLGMVGATVVLGLYVVAHGYITPGGGFQGGVVLAGAAVLVYLAGEYRAYRRVTPTALLDLAEGVGAGTYVVVGLLALLLGHEFLTNFLPLGTAGKLSSGGTIALLNAAVALEVCAAFVLLFTEFLEELIAVEGPEARERTRL
jgi:multicomponent Na+:H+ antiporter subunit B